MCEMCNLKLEKSSEVDFELFCCFPVSKKVRSSEKTHFLKKSMMCANKLRLDDECAQREMRCKVKSLSR